MSSSSSFEQKVVLITGSSSGIGESVAKLFAEKKFRVAITGLNATNLKNAHDRIIDSTSIPKEDLLSIVADLSNIDNAVVIVNRVIEVFGRLDVLVNNAGTYTDTDSTDPNSFQAYQKIMTINTSASVRISMEAIPHLENSHGNIVFVSSVASVKYGKCNYAYRMSKAAMSSYAKCLAIDAASKGIRVNIVSPGPTQTPIQFKRESNKTCTYEDLDTKIGPSTLMGRIGRPNEIANVIYFLSTDKASFVNGTEIFVDGGYITKS